MWSQLKILQHKDVLRDIVNDNIPVPTHIQFELTESCNYACTFCPWHGDNSGEFSNLDFTGKRFFPIKRVLKLIDELEELGVKAISLTGAGENLIHPNFDEVISKLANSNIEFALTSNFGVKLSDDVLSNLLKAKWLRWSVNAADELTYNGTNKPKVKNAYHISKDNISRLINLRKNEPVHIGGSFVIGDYNKHNIQDVTLFTQSLCIDSISFRPDTPMLRTGEIYKYDENTRAILDDCKSYETKDFKIFVNYGRLDDSIKIMDKKLKCYYSNHSVHIISNGDVYPCCMTRYDKKYMFGNLLNSSFKEFWFSKERVDNYKKIFMVNCPSCHHTDTNKMLKNLYEEQIIDNFI